MPKLYLVLLKEPMGQKEEEAAPLSPPNTQIVCNCRHMTSRKGTVLRT